jgi:hypothetical protein
MAACWTFDVFIESGNMPFCFAVALVVSPYWTESLPDNPVFQVIDHVVIVVDLRSAILPGLVDNLENMALYYYWCVDHVL